MLYVLGRICFPFKGVISYKKDHELEHLEEAGSRLAVQAMNSFTTGRQMQCLAEYDME